MASTTLYCDRDCVVREAKPTTNYSGTSSYLSFRSDASNDEEAGCFGFDISSLYGATISSAVFYVSANNNQSGTTVTFRRMTVDSWSETALTWNTCTVTSTNQTTGTVPTTANSWGHYTVTNMLQDAIDNSMSVFGIQVIDLNYLGNGITFNTHEDASYVPYLSITYTPGGNDYYVKSSGGSDSNGGQSWGDAWATVNKGMTDTPTGKTLHIGFGTYASEPSDNKVFPANAITVIYETATTGGGSGTASVEINS